MARKHIKTRKYVPENPEKYEGDIDKITARSSWEYQMMKRFDQRPDIVVWSSEPFAIPYTYRGKAHRYYPDFLIKKRKKDGSEKVILIEVKPYHETLVPNEYVANGSRKKVKKRYIQEVVSYQVNQKKWAAAEEFCRRRGWDFQVITEEDVRFHGTRK